VSKTDTPQKPNATAPPKPKAKAPQKPKAKIPQRGPREGSTMWAAMEVLRGKRNPMTAAEIYAEISERKLAPGLKGKTPQATLAAQLAVNAKRGRYIERTEPGKFRLKRGA
jgi:HB1, ASXL, restriction endonuclease HTH domain